MKSKSYSSHYSLEERMVEPFRSIRWISVSKRTALISMIGLSAYAALWWVFRNDVFAFWVKELNFLIKLIDEPWVVETGVWPSQENPLVQIPKLTASIMPPYQRTWWSFTLGSIGFWILSGYWKSSLLPLKALSRFIIFLVWISLACFALSPLQFRHSVEEWSKIYFLGSYGSFIVYGTIWVFGILWFPIRNWVKLATTLTLIAFEILATPLLLVISSITLKQSSLLLLPLFALLISPILQLGWFVSFYGFALSSGIDPEKRYE